MDRCFQLNWHNSYLRARKEILWGKHEDPEEKCGPWEAVTDQQEFPWVQGKLYNFHIFSFNYNYSKVLGGQHVIKDNDLSISMQTELPADGIPEDTATVIVQTSDVICTSEITKKHIEVGQQN